MEKKAGLGVRGEELKRKEELSGGSRHTHRSFVQSSVLFPVCVLILTRLYVSVGISSSGFVLGPEVFKKGALRTRLRASCTLMAGFWRAQIVGYKFYFLTLKSMCVFTLMCVITLMVKPLKAAAWSGDTSVAQRCQQGPEVPAGPRGTSPAQGCQPGPGIPARPRGTSRTQGYQHRTEILALFVLTWISKCRRQRVNPRK